MGVSTTINIGTTNVNQQGTTVITTTVTLSGSNWQGVPAFTPNIISNAYSIQQPLAQATINGKTTVVVPTGAAGVIIQANIAGTLKVSTVLADTGTFVNHAGAPTIITFDPANLPTSLYLISTGVYVVLLYWF